MNGWFSVQEAARLCGTDEQRITLWMNGNHIAFARFDTVLMIDGASLFALFERNRVATIYDDAPRQKKRGRPGKHSELLNTPLDRLGFRSVSSRLAGNLAFLPPNTCSCT